MTSALRWWIPPSMQRLLSYSKDQLLSTQLFKHRFSSFRIVLISRLIRSNSWSDSKVKLWAPETRKSVYLFRPKKATLQAWTYLPTQQVLSISYKHRTIWIKIWTDQDPRQRKRNKSGMKYKKRSWKWVLQYRRQAWLHFSSQNQSNRYLSSSFLIQIGKKDEDCLRVEYQSSSWSVSESMTTHKRKDSTSRSQICN